MSEWTIEAVEEAMVECHDLWWRSPGAGAWPFAGDGPWHLIRPDYAGEVSTTTLDTGQRVIDVIKVDGAKRPRTPLSSAEVDQRDRVTAWLQHVAEPHDRVLVWMATRSLAEGELGSDWRELARKLKWSKTDRGLAWRYAKAMAQIVCRLNGWPSRRVKALADGWRPSSSARRRADAA